jgi:hypothetical protein
MASTVLHEADLDDCILRLVRQPAGYRLVHLGRRARVEGLVVLERTRLDVSEAEAWRAHLAQMARVVQASYEGWVVQAVELTKRVSAQRGRLRPSSVRCLEAVLERFIESCDRRLQDWVAPWCGAVALAVAAGATGLPAAPEGIAKAMEDLAAADEQGRPAGCRTEVATPPG